MTEHGDNGKARGTMTEQGGDDRAMTTTEQGGDSDVTEHGDDDKALRGTMTEQGADDKAWGR